jgi:hypothetical protein
LCLTWTMFESSTFTEFWALMMLVLDARLLFLECDFRTKLTDQLLSFAKAVYAAAQVGVEGL